MNDSKHNASRRIYGGRMMSSTIVWRGPLLRTPLSSRVVAQKRLRCRAEKENVVYEGAYGSWTIDDDDRREVLLYRAGLSVCAASAALGTALSFAPETLSTPLYNPICFVGILGFGLSLTQVHMYAAEIKKTIQALWGFGALGAVYVAATQDTALPVSVALNPGYVWLVGPFFAAMTGLAIKEGLCYGKLEAALLTFLIPTTLLGHLSQTVPSEALHYLMTGCVILFGILASRKYSQPVKDDIGDKSVFTFLSLPESEREALLENMK